jgi:hypothetical protein
MGGAEKTVVVAKSSAINTNSTFCPTFTMPFIFYSSRILFCVSFAEKTPRFLDEGFSAPKRPRVNIRRLKPTGFHRQQAKSCHLKMAPHTFASFQQTFAKVICSYQHQYDFSAAGITSFLTLRLFVVRRHIDEATNDKKTNPAKELFKTFPPGPERSYC